MLHSLMTRLTMALTLVLVLACGILPAQAAVYRVSIDTSALAGQDGYLDFLLLGLSGAPPVQAQLSNFSGDFAATSFALGDAGGDIATQVAISNGDSWNEFGQWAHFGGTLWFDVSFSGAASSGAGATLSVTLLDANLNYAGLAGDYASFALQPGSATTASASNAASISAVPEPAACALLMAGLLLIGLRTRHRL